MREEHIFTAYTWQDSRRWELETQEDRRERSDWKEDMHVIDRRDRLKIKNVVSV